MDRDKELIKKILIEIEKKGPCFSYDLDIEGYNQDKIKEHLRLLNGDGFIAGEFQGSKNGKNFVIGYDLRLTSKGHDYLEKLEKNDEKIFPITIKDARNIDGPPKPNEVHAIDLKNGKKVPASMQVRIEATRIPNHAHIFVKLPDEEEYVDLGDLPIKNGVIYLPVPLVFLCHAREDAESVKKINSALRQNCILTWLDKQDLLPGENWKRKIEEAIESSDFVLVFLSQKSIQKRGTYQLEIKYALDQMKERPSNEAYIIPILLEDCEPPREFKDIHWSFAWKEGWFETLLKTLRK